MWIEPYRPDVTAEDVARIVGRQFHGDELILVSGLLGSWERRCSPDRRERVQAAALKLAGGSVEQLERLLTVAERDAREILLRAESPGYRQIEVRIRNGRVPSELQERIVAEDRAQYEAWLAGATVAGGAPPW